MTEKRLSKSEIKVIHECLNAAAYGPFFVDDEKDDPYWEVQLIFGLDIEELKEIADSEPDVFSKSKLVWLAINNSLNNLINFPHRCNQELWDKYISVSSNDLTPVFRKWKSAASKDSKV